MKRIAKEGERERAEVKILLASKKELTVFFYRENTMNIEPQILLNQPSQPNQQSVGRSMLNAL